MLQGMGHLVLSKAFPEPPGSLCDFQVPPHLNVRLTPALALLG